MGLAAGAGLASWEPDFWSAIRNSARVEMRRAQERAAEWGLARLSLQAEIASDYFTLRGFDAQTAIYKKSIDLYRRVVELVKTPVRRCAGLKARPVARVESVLYSTEARLAEIQGKAASDGAVHRHPSESGPGQLHRSSLLTSFTWKGSGFHEPCRPRLLERRPDVAAMERRMAEANKGIGIAPRRLFPRRAVYSRRRDPGRQLHRC